MKEILIIKTNNSQEIKNFLDAKKIDYEVQQETNHNERLRKYIKVKSQENIFSDYGKATKDKEREREIKEWDKMESADWE